MFWFKWLPGKYKILLNLKSILHYSQFTAQSLPLPPRTWFYMTISVWSLIFLPVDFSLVEMKWWKANGSTVISTHLAGSILCCRYVYFSEINGIDPSHPDFLFALKKTNVCFLYKNKILILGYAAIKKLHRHQLNQIVHNKKRVGENVFLDLPFIVPWLINW